MALLDDVTTEFEGVGKIEGKVFGPTICTPEDIGVKFSKVVYGQEEEEVLEDNDEKKVTKNTFHKKICLFTGNLRIGEVIEREYGGFYFVDPSSGYSYTTPRHQLNTKVKELFSIHRFKKDADVTDCFFYNGREVLANEELIEAQLKATYETSVREGAKKETRWEGGSIQTPVEDYRDKDYRWKVKINVEGEASDDRIFKVSSEMISQWLEQHFKPKEEPKISVNSYYDLFMEKVRRV